jgi:hypothetical protein
MNTTRTKSSFYYGLATLDKQPRTMHAHGLVFGKRAREEIVPYFHQLFQNKNGAHAQRSVGRFSLFLALIFGPRWVGGTPLSEALNIDEILSRLQRNEGHFAKDAVLEAVGHGNDVIPALLDVLRDVADNPEPYAVDPNRLILTCVM